MSDKLDLILEAVQELQQLTRALRYGQEEMKAQQMEMNAQQEEMKAQQEEMKAQQEEMKEQLQSLNQNVTHMQFDLASLKEGQIRQERILERLSIRSIEQEANIENLKRAK